MAEHTPGPWEVDSGMVQTVMGIPIAHMDREPGNGTLPTERDANARLIAAAPAMLEALKSLDRNMENDRFVDPVKRGMYMAVIRAAINKAEGRT